MYAIFKHKYQIKQESCLTESTLKDPLSTLKHRGKEGTHRCLLHCTIFCWKVFQYGCHEGCKRNNGTKPVARGLGVCKSLQISFRWHDNDVCKEPTRQRICWHFPGLALLKNHGGPFEIVAFSLPHFLYNLSFINPPNAVSLLIDCIMQSSCFWAIRMHLRYVFKFSSQSEKLKACLFENERRDSHIITQWHKLDIKKSISSHETWNRNIAIPILWDPKPHLKTRAASSMPHWHK